MKRVFNFSKWNRNKIAVFHMMKQPGQLLGNLDLLNIPHDVFEGEKLGDSDNYKELKEKYCGMIISGGLVEPYHVPPAMPEEALNCNLPKLGICLGHEILGEYLGAEIIPCNQGRIKDSGETLADLKDDTIFEGIDISQKQMVKMEHYLMLKQTPPGAKLIASTNLTPISGFHHEKKEIWGLQFHPEKDWMHETIFNNFYKHCYDKIK